MLPGGTGTFASPSDSDLTDGQMYPSYSRGSLTPLTALLQSGHHLLGNHPYERFHVDVARTYRRRRPRFIGWLLQIAGERRRRLEGGDLGGGPFLVPIAERCVAAQIAVLIVEARVIEAESLLQIEQLARLPLVQVRDPAELLREDQDAAVSVEDFGLPVCLFQVLAERHRAVVGEDDRVRRLQERDHCLGERLGSGSFIGGEWYFAHEDFDFRQHTLRDRLASHSERRRVRRVAVNHRLHIGTVLHDRQVQQNFAGPLPLSGQLIAVEVDHTDVIGSHEPLADVCRGTEDFVLTDAIGDVPVVGSCEAFVVDPATDFADLFFDAGVVEEWVVGHWRVLVWCEDVSGMWVVCSGSFRLRSAVGRGD